MDKRVNFSSAERELLQSLLIRKYGAIIESKKTDSVSNLEKNKAWETLAEEFNTQASEHESKLKL